MNEQTKEYTFDELVDLGVAAFERQLGPEGITHLPEGAAGIGKVAYIVGKNDLMWLTIRSDESYELIYFLRGMRAVMSVQSESLRACVYSVLAVTLEYVPLSYTLEDRPIATIQEELPDAQ